MSVINLDQYRQKMIQVEQEALDYPYYMYELKNLEIEIQEIEEELGFNLEFIESIHPNIRPMLRCINGGKSRYLENINIG